MDGSDQFPHLHQDSGQRRGLLVELLQKFQQAFLGQKPRTLHFEQFIFLAVHCVVTACDDYDDRAYLLYQPSYPWQLTEADLALTEEHLVSVFRRYVGMLTDEEVEVAYQEVENGG